MRVEPEDDGTGTSPLRVKVSADRYNPRGHRPIGNALARSG